jgi:hypothetical protein
MCIQPTIWWARVELSYVWLSPFPRLLGDGVVMSLPGLAINPIIEVGRESTAPTACLTRDFQRSHR